MKKLYSPPLAEELSLLAIEIFLQSGSTEPITEDDNIYNW